MLNSISRIANGAGRSIQKVLEFLPASLGGLKTLESIELKLLDIAIQRENLLVSGKSNRAYKERLESLNAQELVQTRLIESGNYLESIEPLKTLILTEQS